MAAVFFHVNPFISPLKQSIKVPSWSIHSHPHPHNPSTAVRLSLHLNRTVVTAAMPAGNVPLMWPQNGVIGDVCATGVATAVALGILRLWEETAKRGVFNKMLNRKLVHISIGLAFMLCWPLFSSGYRGAVFASLVPGLNIIRMLITGLGIFKDEATVKSMSRHGDHS